MSTHKHIDRICAAAVALSLLLTLLFMNGQALGIQPASRVMGYEGTLFDTSKVHTIEIVMDGWDDFIESCENEEYNPCSVVIDNEAYKNVGIRAKGNTSLSTVSQMGSDRYSFKIEFDQYDSGKTYHGLDKLCLNNLIQDNTMMKDYLTYRLMGEFGVNAPLCSYVYITVNGEDWGLYLAVEGVEDSFLQRNYGKNHGELYKPDSMSFGGGRGNGRDFDMDEFMNQNQEQQSGDTQGNTSQRFEPSASGGDRTPPQGFDPSSFGGQAPGGNENRPESFTPPSFGGQTQNGENQGTPPEGFDPGQLFGGGPGGGFGGMGSGDVKLQYSDDDPDSYSNIFNNAKTNVTNAGKDRLIRALKALGEGDAENALDMDQVLRYLVVHNFVVNSDSYTGAMVHNYYLYEEDGRLSMLPWDYNLAFGTFQGGDASSAVNDPIDTPLSVSGNGDRPMADWMFSTEEYTALYHQYFRQFLDSMDCAAILDETQALIVSWVERDPTKFCTCEEFETAVTTLKEFCSLRIQSVSGQLDGTIPSTDDGQSGDRSALIDASALNLSDMGTMGGGGGPGGGSFPGGPGGENGGGNQPGEGWNLPRDVGGQGGESNQTVTNPPNTPDTGGDFPAGGGQELPQGQLPGGSLPMPGNPQTGNFENRGGNAPKGGGPSGEVSAGLDVTVLILAGASVLVLLAGLWIAFRFKRPGGVRNSKTRGSRCAGPVSAHPVQERHAPAAAPAADSERSTKTGLSDRRSF